MRIRLKRSGGFAGVTLEREVETETLSASERRLLQRLGPSREGLATPDTFAYELNGIPVTDGKTPITGDRLGQVEPGRPAARRPRGRSSG